MRHQTDTEREPQNRFKEEYAHPSLPSSGHARACATSTHLTSPEPKAITLLIYTSHPPYSIYRIRISRPSFYNETMDITRAPFASPCAIFFIDIKLTQLTYKLKVIIPAPTLLAKVMLSEPCIF